MATTTEPLLGDVRQEAGDLWDELRALAAARLELARVEASLAAAQAKRFAIVAGVCLVCLLVSLPLLVVAAAAGLNGVAGLSHHAWLGLIGGTMLLASVGMAVVAWLRFRRHFDGFARSLAELREDAIWLQEKRWFTNAEEDDAEGCEDDEEDDSDEHLATDDSDDNSPASSSNSADQN